MCRCSKQVYKKYRLSSILHSSYMVLINRFMLILYKNLLWILFNLDMYFVTWQTILHDVSISV